MFSELSLKPEIVKKNLLWDLDLQREFRMPRRTGYSFVIDVLDGNPQLALYHLKNNYSTSTTLSEQPPRELLFTAVREQTGAMPGDNLYPVNTALRRWIEQYLLKK